jgi:hypothetical protein
MSMPKKNVKKTKSGTKKVKCPWCSKIVDITKKGGYSPHYAYSGMCIGSGFTVKKPH